MRQLILIILLIVSNFSMSVYSQQEVNSDEDYKKISVEYYKNKVQDYLKEENCKSAKIYYNLYVKIANLSKQSIDSQLETLISECEKKVTEQSNKINDHEYVDLGLSVKWATCNVGATSPEEYGDYFAWGETTTKGSYTSSNSETRGPKKGDISGNPNYDVARATWGGTWRLPTSEEFEELIQCCTWTWTTQNDKNGYKVTSKKNGNSIFLPAAGFREDFSLNVAGSGGVYWSSSPYDSNNAYIFLNAYMFVFISSEYEVVSDDRSYGCSVRAVSE